MVKKLYGNIIILSMLSLFSVNSVFAQTQPPANLDQAQEAGERALEISKEKMPGIVEKIWQKEVLPVWQKMLDWFNQKIGIKIKGLFRGEIEKRGSVIKEEFQRERQEAQEEAPKIGQTLWQKLKELIK